MNKPSGVFLYHTSCLNEKCGSSDGLAVYGQEDGTVDGHCFVCEGYFKKEFEGQGMGKITQPREDYTSYEKVEDIKEYPIRELSSRGISKLACEKYGVRVGIDPETGEVDSHYYPVTKGGNLSGYRKRKLPKDFVGIGDNKSTELFGQNIAGDGGKLLVIVEGELDALSTYDMFRQRGKNYRVVGIPGANTRVIKNNLEWIEKFDTIILALDQDVHGEKTTRDICDILSSGKVKVASFSENDPNDMLVKGKGEEFFSSIMNAKGYRPDGIVSIDDIFEEAIKPIEWGLSWPWEKLTELTFGKRRKEIYGLGGGTGTGKTEILKEDIDHLIAKHNLPAGVIFLEEAPAMTAKILAGKHANKTFHIPDSGWTNDELKDNLNYLRGKVYFYDHWGSKDYEGLRNKIRYMVVTLGIKDIYLDHLTALVADEPDENKALGRIMSDLAALTQELDFTLVYISHLTTPHGTPHEEGGRVTASQFRGSRAIAFWSHFMFGLERNQQAEDPEERHTITFRVLKDRYTGRSTGETFYMGYDHETGRLFEKEIIKPQEEEF